METTQIRIYEKDKKRLQGYAKKFDCSLPEAVRVVLIGFLKFGRKRDKLKDQIRNLEFKAASKGVPKK